MTIICNDDGQLEVQHWPPLPIDDTIEILDILKVSYNYSIRFDSSSISYH